MRIPMVSEKIFRLAVSGVGVRMGRQRVMCLLLEQERNTFSMSTCGEPFIMYSRSRRRKAILDVDLNIVPSSENREQEGTSAHARYQEGQVGQQADSVIPQTIDLDEFDDDVIISSPRAFAEAKNNSRRTKGRTVLVDVESEEQSSRFIAYSRNNRRRVSANQRISYPGLYINLEESSTSVRENVQSVAAPPPPPPPPPPKEPTFSCPVCMGPLVEEMSTKCGHIFCKACIKAAVAVQSKCPTCRKKITMKNTIRVYLPAAK